MLSLDWSIVWIVINLIILYLLLKRFLFGPVTAIMDKRAKMIEDELKQAEVDKLEAAKLKDDYEQTIKEAHVKAQEISNAAKASTDMECDEMIVEARAESARIIKDAEKSIDNDRKKAMDDAKYEIADLALLAAAKVLGANIDSDKDKRLAESFLTEVGETK